ncbi:MAG: holin family protein [Desulfamplus sp.]|nr:holin family protein [Desulfamplus sp.]
MSLDPLTAILDVGGKILDKFFPDAGEREKAKGQLLQMAQDGALKQTELQLSAILAEAKSADPYTSRARPSFLYVCYILLLSAIPMGCLAAYSLETAQAVIAGFKMWLEAIPDPLYVLMGSGYLGYTTAREVGKWKSAK